MRIFRNISHLQSRFLCALPRWPEVKCEDASSAFHNLYGLLNRKKENVLVLSQMKIWGINIVVCKVQFQ